MCNGASNIWTLIFLVHIWCTTGTSLDGIYDTFKQLYDDQRVTR